MKRIIFLALILSAWTFSTYAQTFSPKTNFNNIKQQAESTDDDDDEYEEGGNYEERDEILAGDQFLKLHLMEFFPLTFLTFRVFLRKMNISCQLEELQTSDTTTS